MNWNDKAREQQQSILLDAYYRALVHDLDTEPPTQLDRCLAATARQVAKGLAVPYAEAEFAARLRGRLEHEAQALVQQGTAHRVVGTIGTPTPAQQRRSSRRYGTSIRWSVASFVTVVLLAIVSLGTYLFILKPHRVSAQEVIQKAQAAATSPAVSGVQSFVLTEVWRTRPTNARLNVETGYQEGVEIVREIKRWYQAPDCWRSEYRERVLRADGTEMSHFTSVQVSDGTDVWLYDPDENRVTVNRFSPDQDGKGGVALFGQLAGDLNALLKQASTCYDARVTGSANVAGRSTHVIDLGATKCPSADVPEWNGRQVIWVDKESFFVLKQEQYSTEGDKLIMQSETTSVQYNVSLDRALFTFTPPAGASVLDGRPHALPTLPPSTPSPIHAATPGPTADPMQAALLTALQPLAWQVEYPLLVPDRIPSGLVPRLPKLLADEMWGKQLWIEYVPPEEVEQDSLPQIEIVEQRATYQSIMNWTERAIPVQMPTGKGWMRRGGQGSDSAVILLRDGTQVSISSFVLAPEDLLKIALSLQSVPGSHTPLPEPQPPTLAEVRAMAPYPIFVPTWVPEGLTPEPPVGYRIEYHYADGRRGLEVSNGTGLADDPRRVGDLVMLPNGLTAHLLDMPAESGGPILWWVQEGTALAIAGPQLTRSDLVKIAASMSKTADLGPTEPRPGPTPAPAVPPPTPMPTPAFQVLRPTWLPEPMAMREQVDGQIVVLGFDPLPGHGTSPHEVMTLTERPSRLVGGGALDPPATVERIGAYEVTVIHRGPDCTMFDWDAGDLHLSLSNVYDPPGHLRYSCDQLRKMIESIR